MAKISKLVELSKTQKKALRQSRPVYSYTYEDMTRLVNDAAAKARMELERDLRKLIDAASNSDLERLQDQVLDLEAEVQRLANRQ